MDQGKVLTVLLIADTRTVPRHSFEATVLDCACSLYQTAAVTNYILRVKIMGPMVEKSWHLPIFELSLMSNRSCMYNNFQAICEPDDTSRMEVW